MTPDGWTATELGDMAHFSSGGTPSKQRADFWGGGFPWISGKDLKSHYLEKSIDTLSESGFHLAKKAPKGATLVLVRGMTLLKDFPVGYATREMAFNQDVKALNPKSDVNPLYLSYLLLANKSRIRQLVSTAGHGTGRIDTESLKEFPVNRPPYEEQIKIARILSTWDRAIKTVVKLIDNSRAQKKALMQQLLSGKKRFIQFKEERRKVPLHDLTRIFDGTHSTPEYVANGVPFYSVEHLTSNNFSNTKYISESVFKNENSRVELKKGDILMTRIGDIGTARLIDWDVRASFYVSLALIKNSREFDSEFLSHYIGCEDFQRELWKRTIHVAFPKKINLGEIGNCLVLLPSSEEQNKIASILSTVDNEIATAKKGLDLLKLEKKALMQQLLTGKRRVKIGLPDAKAARARQG